MPGVHSCKGTVNNNLGCTKCYGIYEALCNLTYFAFFVFLYIFLIQLNASDDRGIGTVRGPVLSFASTRTIFNKGFKLVILDEADAMTNDAQNALRRGNMVFLFYLELLFLLVEKLEKVYFRSHPFIKCLTE